MKQVPTYQVQIFVGLREGYTGRTHEIEEVCEICQTFVNLIGWCVSITPTEFIYKDGHEGGAIIGSINYPRFPSTPSEIDNNIMALAEILLKKLKQERVSIVFPDRTIMLEKDDYND